MSLSSLLLSSADKNAIDAELDALFTSKHVAQGPPRKPATIIPAPGSSKDIGIKRKIIPGEGHKNDRAKRVKYGPSHSSTSKPSESVDTSESASRKPSDEAKRDEKKGKTLLWKGKRKEIDHNDEGNSDIEDARQNALSGSKNKFVPSDETPGRRDQRTIFIGNLPMDVAQQRPLLKKLQRHILSQVPSAKIESTRLRSVPFRTPSSKLESKAAGVGMSKSANPKASPGSPTQPARPHDLDRTSAWRSNQGEDITERNDEKLYLTPNQKKKIAFINHEFHSTADTINAYVVFAHPLPPEKRPANLPPLAPVMNPYEAAQLAAVKCDGTLFLERVIRVDLIGKKADVTGDVDIGVVETDPKLSVFVGNLDFASKEEDLRIFFDGVISAERGPPDDDDENETADMVVKKPKTWVTRVRIVRDRETQLGKGFAYVQFADRECVDEMLAIEEGKLKFAKRKLRIQRCKTLPGASTSAHDITSSSTEKFPKPRGKLTSTPVPVPVPKGNPALGEKLAHMTKEARKRYKSSDTDRVARRLAKKKARIALAIRGSVKVQGKERVRVRKSGNSGGGTGGPKKKTRSEKEKVPRK